MKKISLFLAVLGMAFSLVGAEAKQLLLLEGSMIIQDVPFKVENVSISNKDVVRVELASENGRQIRISGLQNGITDVQVLGGGMSQVFLSAPICQNILTYRRNAYVHYTR